MPKKKIVVTGANGFIGSRLCKELEKKYSVIKFDLNGKGKNFFEGSVLEEEKLEKAFQKADAVVHLAAVSVASSAAEPKKSFETNVEGTKNVLETAFKQGIKKIVFASSALVYGTKYKRKISESDALLPEDNYAKQKEFGEKLCREYRKKGLDVRIVRMFNVYGKSQEKRTYNDVITIFFNKISKGEKIWINNPGKNSRDFINISDAVKGIALVLEKKKAKNEVFNIGTGKATDLMDLAENISKALGKEPMFEKANEEKEEIKFIADTSKAEKILGFRAGKTLEKGLKEMSKNFK
ncbi:MAG: NAD(P)-dependent oxidoreductase [Candidatus Diapherotrites archaeon]